MKNNKKPTLFWNRKRELEHLKVIHSQNAAAFIKIFGRRRVGKTQLVVKFLKMLQEGTYLYYYVDKAEEKTYFRTISDAIEQQLNEKVHIEKWDDFFEYVASKSQKRFVLVIDEAPRFMDSKSIFLTRLQHAWDTHPQLENTKLMLIIIGSSIGMMERMTSQNGPLYGRVTHTMKISPFSYADFREAFPGLSEHEIIQFYSVFGGTPHYVKIARNHGGKIHQAITSLIVQPQSTLSKEADELLEIESIREPNRYYSILKAIGEGKLKLPEIAHATGIQKEQLPAYLTTLKSRLDLVEPADPIGGKKRNARYEISDNFFRFWFRFIFPNRSAIELGNSKDVQELISHNLQSFIGKVFERITRELFILYQGKELLGIPMRFDSIGAWWSSSGVGEIDLVARHEKSKTTYVADIKYTVQKYDFSQYNVFEQHLKNLPLGGRQLQFIVSRSGFTRRFRTFAQQKNIKLIDLEQLSKLFSRA